MLKCNGSTLESFRHYANGPPIVRLWLNHTMSMQNEIERERERENEKEKSRSNSSILSMSSIFVLHDDRYISKNVERIILILNIGKEHLHVCRVNIYGEKGSHNRWSCSIANKPMYSLVCSLGERRYSYFTQEVKDQQFLIT